ncbi:MAG TPA: hypothetical protein VHB30_02985 [Solirubrobacteraceae bacterium]|nr:hypothetical protein [Solirubrobacteraceae bacterium]
MSPRRREAAAVGALALAAVVLFAVAPTYPNYDAYYHLVWGRELLDGQAPTFSVYAAPTEHPLYLAICALVGAVFGEHGDRALVALGALSLVWLSWATWRVGRATFGTWAGVLAGAFVASSFALLLYAARAYDDVPFLALVLTAAMVEAERAEGGRPRRRLVLALLAVAGLLRPEAWVLAGLYWLWRGRDLRTLAVVLAAPALWAAVDWAVTGHPLHSITATSDLADALHRRRGIEHVPHSFVSFLVDVARPPVAAAGVLGLWLAWRDRARLPTAYVPAALLVGGSLTFLVTGAAGLSILPRYLTVPVVALCLFAGHAVAVLARDRRLLAAMVVVGLVFLGLKHNSFTTLVHEVRFDRDSHADLVALLRSPEVSRGRDCGPVSFPNYRGVPNAKWILDSEDVVARSDRRPRHGVAVFTTTKLALQRFGLADGASRTTNTPDPGFRLVPATRTGMFVARISCPALGGG